FTFRHDLRDVVYFNVLSQDCVIVNSEETARLLADKRSTIHSEWSHLPIPTLIKIMHDVCLHGFGIGCMTPGVPYGDDCRVHKKPWHPSPRPDVVEIFHAA
ncbi:hypothetical protein BKA82DRAFT_63375, partial [Pisolithus tinctorius]